MKPEDLDFADQPDQTAYSTQIKGSEKKAATGFWVAALIPLVVLAIFVWKTGMPLMLPGGFPNPFIGLISLVSAIFVFRGIWETVRLKRFGDPVLDLTRVPVPLGGPIDGRINLGDRVTTAPPFNLKLQCIHRVLQQSGKNSHYVETILWSQDKSVSLLPGGIVPVSIAVSPDQQESNGAGTFDQILWRLTVTAPFRGMAFLEKYEIPVQGRTASAQKIAEERQKHPEMLTPATPRKMFLTMLPITIIGLAICAFGFYLLWFGIADFQKARTSEGWPTVAGRVMRSIQSYDRAIFTTPPASNFIYTYSVNGTNYTGHTIYPHLFWRTSGISKLLQGYPANSSVAVSYSPTDPTNSCLLPGLRAAAFQRLIMAALILDFGFLCASACVFAPLYGEASGNAISYRKGTPASKISGWAFLLLFVLGIALWWIS